MKANKANLLDLLSIGGHQFVVPIYQRVYSWTLGDCERLWDDVIHAGTSGELGAHFTGSIVHVEKDQSTLTATEPDLIIDGQQRVTTVSLLLAALATRLEALPEDEREPVEGFSPKKIRNRYLTNADEEGEKFFKLILSQGDRDALKAIVRGLPVAVDSTSRVLTNFEYFVGKISDTGLDLLALCRGLQKLEVVDVTLTRGEDNPQLVFETMNSTGKELSQADLIRNFVLMDLAPSEQERLYEGYWLPMEQRFRGDHEDQFDEFVYYYLLPRTVAKLKRGDIYESFKSYTADRARDGFSREQLVVDLAKHSEWYAAIALGAESDPGLAAAFAEIDGLRATVVYPFFLRLYEEYDAGRLSRDDFEYIVEVVTSYIVRRAICDIPTNSLRQTFRQMSVQLRDDDHLDHVLAHMLALPANRRFPSDQEFTASLVSRDFYGLRRKSYFFGKFENHGRKELVSTAEYTVEHIMPQTLTPEWEQSIGENWEDVHERLVHTLGNLTLTGYNPEYSNHTFVEKRDMDGGFRNSPLRLNDGLGQLETWDEAAIHERAARLAEQALAIWARPQVDAAAIEDARSQYASSDGFDWSTVHSILDAMPAGNWTSYNLLAEAAGTGSQAVAAHLSKCTTCSHAYRVMTWDGRIAEGFKWGDTTDTRKPESVLRDEGVTFTDGKADPAQRLQADELLALVDE